MNDNSDMNKKQKINNDDMNIKSHLNTSLDLDGISVSEELLNRTLAAIKEQQMLREDQSIQKGAEKLGTKIVPWNRYVRGFAGVAAALLLVVVGYNVIKQMPLIGQKSSSMNNAAPEYSLMMDQTTTEGNDMSKKEVPAAESTASDQAAADATQSAPTDESEFTISAETFPADTDTKLGASLYGTKKNKSDAGDGVEGETQITSIPEEGTATQEFSTTLRAANDLGKVYSFRDIFVPSPEEAEYITISNNKNDSSVTLTSLEDIQAFYLVMDAHKFTGDDQAAAADQDYTVEMKNPDTQSLYTLHVGAKLVVEYTQGDTVSEYVYYPDDDMLLKQDIEAFFQEYAE